jgi:hypothetical protein
MRALFISLLAFASASAIAQDDSGAYVGFGIGQLDYEEEDFGLTLEDTTLFYKVYGGYRFDETWAFEAYYGQTDDLEWTESGFDPGIGDYSVRLAGDYDLREVRGLAHLDWFLIGLGYWDADLSASLSGTSDLTGPFSISESDSDSGASIIVGGEWDLDTLAIRAELEYFDTESTVDAYTIGVGIQFTF